ncbi:hypothetical protein D5S17_32745 [Pseudonocardiaceae bacterium YIM PH 21723]|nr:hypothetical protein D5S17_32745 [Pseudonocardiaceae bacterium YIM PH 21723]
MPTDDGDRITVREVYVAVQTLSAEIRQHLNRQDVEHATLAQRVAVNERDIREARRDFDGLEQQLADERSTRAQGAWQVRAAVLASMASVVFTAITQVLQHH